MCDACIVVDNMTSEVVYNSSHPCIKFTRLILQYMCIYNIQFYTQRTLGSFFFNLQRNRKCQGRDTILSALVYSPPSDRCMRPEILTTLFLLISSSSSFSF